MLAYRVELVKTSIQTTNTVRCVQHHSLCQGVIHGRVYKIIGLQSIF